MFETSGVKFGDNARKLVLDTLFEALFKRQVG